MAELGLKDSPFYGHDSSFYSIEEVLNYKNLGVKENSLVPSTKISEKFRPLNLSITDISRWFTSCFFTCENRNIVGFHPNKSQARWFTSK